MPRFFVALPLPDEAKDRLVAVQPPVTDGMRLIGRDEFHLTLHFIGEVSPLDIDKIRAAMGTIRMNAFTIGLKGIGKFPPERQANVLWAGVEASAELAELHRAVGAVLVNAIGFRPEDRPYSPHVTLARLDEPAPPDAIDRYLIETMEFTVPSVRLDCFALYSSDFAGSAPKYQEEATFPLMPNERYFRPLRGYLNGDEPDEQTYFAYSATLRIFGTISNLDQITTKLGIEPTYTHRKGEKRGENSPPYKHDMWSYSPAIPEDEPLERHVEALWSAIRKKTEYLLSLKSSLTVDVFLGYRSNCDHAGVIVPHTCLEMFTTLQIPFGLSIITV
jgi:2'-5' RNA ligase